MIYETPSCSSTVVWFERESPRAKEAGIPIIASLAGLNLAKAADLARRAVAAGADMIEMPTVCPHMGEILEAMFPGMTMPPPEVHDAAPYEANVRAVKEVIDVPVIAKFSALFHANVVQWTTAVEEAGADAIACADAFGPAIKINIESGEPSLGGPRGAGGLTEPALKPITLRMILEMAQHVSIPLIGVGGISRAEDAIECLRRDPRRRRQTGPRGRGKVLRLWAVLGCVSGAGNPVCVL